MSVAIAATNGNGLTASTNLSNPQSFTKCIWAKFPSTPSVLSNLLCAQDSGFSNAAALTPAQFNAGDLSVQSGPGAGDDSFASQPTWTNWNFFALTGTAAGAGSLIGYFEPNSGGGLISHAITGVNFTNSNDNIGKNTMSVITTVAYYKEWSSVLTPTQLQAEFLKATPVLVTGLRRYLALAANASAGTDTSGNGFNMTATGTSDGVGNPTFPASGGKILLIGANNGGF